jgi:hypothetical protein
VNHGAAVGNCVWVNWRASGTLYGNVIDTCGGNHLFQSGSSLFTSNSLLHVALTFDKNFGTAKLYLNGMQVATTIDFRII